MRNKVLFYIITLLIPYPCFSGEMERNIVVALMSYNKPKTYKENATKEINRAIGRDTAIFLTSTYQILKYNKIQIPVHLHDINYTMDIDKNSIHIFYKKEF